jgi:hypothetical protein
MVVALLQVLICSDTLLLTQSQLRTSAIHLAMLKFIFLITLVVITNKSYSADAVVETNATGAPHYNCWFMV